MSQSTSYQSSPVRGVLSGYIRFMDAVTLGAAFVAGALLALGVLSVVHMVFVRYVMGESTVWQTEFTTFAIASSMLLAAGYVLKTGGHVAVTVLPDALHGLPKRLMRLCASLVGLTFCLALTYGCWYYLYEAYAFEWTTGTVWNPPLWVPILPVAVGSALLSLQYVAEILRAEL